MATSQPVTGGPQVAGGDTTADAPPHRPRGPAARARRWWPEILVVAVLAFGLSYELLRYDHVLAGHLAALVAAGILGVGIVVVLADRRRSRLGRGLIGLVLAVGFLFVGAQLRPAPDPLVGDWNLSVGAPAVVTITRTANGYAVTTKTPAQARNSDCIEKPGVVLANFSGSAPSYVGQYLFVNTSTCQVVDWRPATFVLGNETVDIVFPDHWRLILTKVR